MKSLRRIFAFVLCLCLLTSMLPTVQFAKAAEITQRYELDTDGIDVGATYLIVNAGTAGDGNALRFYYNSYWSRDLRNQSLQIQSEDGVVFIDAGFTNEADCQFQFTGAGAGSVTHGDYNLNLENSRFDSGTTGNTLTFTHVGDGQYRIHYGSWFRTYYLRYNNSDWSGSTSTASVYLFKLTDYVVGYDLIFDGNGYTAGTLPDNATKLSSGEYSVPEPKEPLRKDVGEDTYLFQCWNTAADGSGTEYKPGETIMVTGDTTLYAQWYLQTKYTVSMITYLDNVATDVEDIAGYDRQFYAKLEGGDDTYISLTRRAEGTYSAKVVENGTYTIYAKTQDGKYEPVHGHAVVIYGQDGSTECQHYSVSYDVNGGAWAEGEMPDVEYYHYGEEVTTYDKIPTKEENRFLHWKDQNGNMYTASQLITSGIKEKTTLTAVWEKTITVTVNVAVNHNAKTTGQDNDQTMRDVLFTLMREENGVNLPVVEKSLTGGTTNADNITTYQVVFEDMPQGIYHVASSKSNYETTITYEGEIDYQQVININLQYAPENFDLVFDVEVQADNAAEKELMPKAVNVKVSYWGFDENNVLGWHIITQQAGDLAPTTIMIDKDGKGIGFYPVWQYWSGSKQAYEYRLEVTSFVMPDGSIVPASGDKEVYTADGSGLYTATVQVADGRVPAYPEGSNTKTELTGAYYDAQKQVGEINVVVEINPYTVTFDAGDGLVNGQNTVVLDNQYRYPSLRDYVAVPDKADKLFICWTDAQGNPVEDLGGRLLTEDVTYYARYNENITLSGTVSADATYQQDNQTVYINDVDRVETVWVVLQKKVGDAYNDIDSVAVDLTYKKNDEGKYTVGLGSYTFTDLPNDGTEYRVQTLVRNYADTYDNDQNKAFSKEETVANIDTFNAKAQVDINLGFSPDDYQQAIRVDATQIHKDLRPTGALAQILYRDLGDIHHYAVISQHTVDPYGIKVSLNSENATGIDFYDVWNWHTNGTLYEYQAQISKVYGNNVPGAYSEEGTPYTEDSPFTIVYGPANNYLKQTTEGGVMLEATLVPKQYAVKLDLNLGNDLQTPVVGLEEYVVDDPTGGESYAFMHTWSYAEQFTAYPYREGYVFKGWSSPNTNDVYIQDGVIHVGNTLANDITLTAQWEKMSGTDYTILYLELNTDKVLRGATMISGAMQGTSVSAADMAVAIEGFVYAGAMVDGRYVDKVNNPVMSVSNDPAKNLMVIYYLPDGSDGYTEQVESNLELNKTAVLENDGTYTITLDTYTKDNPITTLIQQNTPLDIVLVLDQSGSLAANNFAYLNELQAAVDNFVESVADHGRQNEVDHRIAIVGYAGNASDSHSSDPVKATGGKESDTWINTGVFDSNGEYHLYNVNGFNYTKLSDTSTIKADGIYYTKVTVDGQDRYLLLTYHDEYRHLITEEEARVAVLQGQAVFGYVYNEQNVGGFVELTRNNSGLWLYGNKQLYSEEKFFTYHTDVWTHRDGLSPRQIHAYGVGASYAPVDGHEGVYTREETTGNSFQHSIYEDALVPVSVGAAGSGGTNPGLLKATQSLGADGATRASYGMEMANEILAANPVDDGEGRVRLVVMFTDGEPGYLGFDSSSGDQYYDQAVTEANNAIAYAYETKNTYGAYVYTIGLYESAGVEATSEVAYYMNALSSNYPNAKSMDDIKAVKTYVQAASDTVLENNGKLFVKDGNSYYEIKYGYVRVSGNKRQYCWYYTRNNSNYSISTATYPTVGSDGKVGNYTIYQSTGGYVATEHSGYYATTESSEHLRDYFENVLRDITTKITTKIILESDTILRDIMNQGLVLTNGTVITVSTQEGNYDLDTQKIVWATDEQGNPILEKKVSLELSSGKTSAVAPSPGTDENGDPKRGVEIIAYNWNAENATDPTKANYSPHTVDITGYDFHNWYISQTHTKGYKMVVTITRVEATDDVEWGRSTATNNGQSGLWLPADEDGNRQLLLPFEQPSTIFVERAYVLDYGKEFTLSDWYFDDAFASDGTKTQNATPVHLDCDITNGMNWFGTPNTANAINGAYGNTKYGNVKLENGEVTYSPTSMNWGGYDQFYVFGNTWRKTVVTQDANKNGNLWNKVTVIPANNIYYEDSFVTTSSTTQNGIQGFTFTGAWSVEGEDGNNKETPEHMESAPYGDVHGWTDSLGDDVTFTDGSAHVAFPEGFDKELGASLGLTFTGTGVEVYTRTNADSGMVVAVLNRITKGEDGKENTTFYQSLGMDNLAVSGDYYHIPTIAFKELPYGTYTLQIYATAVTKENGNLRCQYYVDGVRIHNPLGNTTNYQSDIIKDAYGLENNAVFTEIRDILLDYGDFNIDMPNDTEGKMGAVFIDQIKPGQGSGQDKVDTGVPTYQIGTFENYGPKNEVYLSAGQAIVLKVEEDNHYFVGMKSLTGTEVTVNLSGIDQEEPTTIKLNHTTDMYYQVTPVDGYIVIQNGNEQGAILALTNLRTTNYTAPAANGGVVPVESQEAVQLMSDFSEYLLEKQDEEEIQEPSEPEVEIPSVEDQMQESQQQANELFTDVRRWLDIN